MTTAAALQVRTTWTNNSAADAFGTTTDQDTGFHHAMNMATGEVLPKAYPMRKTALRAARNMSDAALADHASRFGPIDEPDEPATSSPLLDDGPVTFSDDEPAHHIECANPVKALPNVPTMLVAEGSKKPQVNRQLLAKCHRIFDGEACGYQCRLARKWIVEVGAPICPRCQVAMVCEGLDVVAEEVPEGEGDE